MVSPKSFVDLNYADIIRSYSSNDSPHLPTPPTSPRTTRHPRTPITPRLHFYSLKAQTPTFHPNPSRPNAQPSIHNNLPIYSR
jgi:hypothetical protein